MEKNDPQSTAALSRLLGMAVSVTPSQMASWFDESTIGAALMQVAPPRRSQQDESSPLWEWLQTEAAWDTDDLATLDRWCGSRLAWWMHPVDGSGKPMLDAWLDKSAELIARDGGMLALLASVPDDCFKGMQGAARMARIMQAERSQRAEVETPIPTPATDGLLARGLDPFLDIGNLIHLSSMAQVEQVRRHHAAEAADWLADPEHYASAASGRADADICAALREMAAAKMQAAPDGLVEHDRALTAALFQEATAALSGHLQSTKGLAGILTRCPHLPDLRDRAGRTVLMAAMHSGDGVKGSPRWLLPNIGTMVHARANRALCAGVDAEGRSLWPYIFRAMSKGPNTGIVWLRQAMLEQSGQPERDAHGFGMLHQVLYDRQADGSYVPHRLYGFKDASGAVTAELLAEAASPSVWLAEGNRPDLPVVLLDRLVSEDRPDRRMVPGFRKEEAEFINAVGRLFTSGHADISVPWRNLFMNAILLEAAGQSVGLHDFEDIYNARLRPWLLPGAALHPKVKHLLLLAADADAPSPFGDLFERIETLGAMAANATSLSHASHRHRRLP